MMNPRILLISAAAVLALSACNREAEKAERPAAPAPGAPEAKITPADAAAPLTFANATPHASVKLTLPEAIKPYPDLHARLYGQEVGQLRQFVEGAQADRTEAGGDEGLPPYEKTITFAPGAETGKLFSLQRTDFDYSGGAHPNTLSTGILWDKALKRLIGPGDLFRRGADLSPLDQALCTAINAAKRARVPDARTLSLNGGGDWTCPRAADTPFVLTPGSVGGKAGGLTFLIGAYQVGPYVEGSYEIAIPHAVFHALLAPAYADEFAGQPTGAGEISGR